MLEEENDEEMREMAKEELSDAKKRIEELEHELKILLLQKTLMMIRTLSWRSVQVQVVTRQLFSQLNFTVCIPTTQTASTGK